VAALEALAGLGVGGEDPATGAWLAELKVDPGQVGRDALTAELGKLARVRNLGLPSGLFDSWSDSLAAAWRARPHRPRSDTLGHTVEASAQRLRDHLRRPHRPIHDELIKISYTGHWKSPMPG